MPRAGRLQLKLDPRPPFAGRRRTNMNRIKRLLVAGALAAAAGGTVSGCVDNNETLFVVGVLALDAPQCTFKADPTTPMLIEGTLDVKLRHSYLAGILVGNQYTPRGQKQNLKAESTRVTLRGAEITLTDSVGAQIQCSGNTSCSSFTVYGTGFVDTNKAEEPGWGFFAAELIPQSVGFSIGQAMESSGLIAKTVYASVKVFGESLGGQDLTSSVLSFPIKVCQGCLIGFPLQAVVGSQCVVSATSVPSEQPCIMGQDAVVDCRLCAGQTDACKTPFAIQQ
jgi:hypothetical protein